MIEFNRNLNPQPEDSPLWEEQPSDPKPSETPAWEEDVEESLRDRIAMLEEENDILEGTNLKLRAVLTAYAGILAAIEETARNYRNAGPF